MYYAFVHIYIQVLHIFPRRELYIIWPGCLEFCPKSPWKSDWLDLRDYCPTHPGMIIEDMALSAMSYRLPAVKGKLYILACKCEPMELASACQSILAMATEESRSNMLDVHSSVEQTGLGRIALPRLDKVFGARFVSIPGRAKIEPNPRLGRARRRALGRTKGHSMWCQRRALGRTKVYPKQK